MITLPLTGTYNEFYDIYREVLTKNDLEEVLVRLEQHIARTPDVEEVLGWMERADLAEIDVEVENFSLLFKSSREFFFAPVIEFGPLSDWKEVAGKGQEMQEVFWHIKEAIDAYFANRAFEITVKAACLRAKKPEASGGEPRPERPPERPPEARPPVEPRRLEPEEEDEQSDPRSSFLRDDFKLEEEEEEPG